MSEQQNPREVLQSLQQPIGLNGNNGQPDSKPFSIRQYVLTYRQKDIFHSWPFPKKYLQMCLNHGINTVLPPFEPHHLAIESLRGGLRHWNRSQQNKNVIASSIQRICQKTIDKDDVSKEECSLIKTNEAVSKNFVEVEDRHISLSSNTNEHEENDNHLSSDVTSSIIVSNQDQPSANIPASLLHDETMNSSKRLRLKRRRHKGKHKKKSVVDVLSVAKPCTYEDRLRINRLYYHLSKPPECEVEETEDVIDVEKSELTEASLNNMLQKDDCEGDIKNRDQKRLVVKLKFSGYSSNSSNMDQEERERGFPNT